jgi:hypothetical protein
MQGAWPESLLSIGVMDKEGISPPRQEQLSTEKMMPWSFKEQ